MNIENMESLGRSGITFCATLGRAGVLLAQAVWCKPNLRQGFTRLVEQIYGVGFLSLIIILISALFIGMVVGLQGYNTLIKFSAAQQLGQLLALSVVRELGPVVTALLFAGRAGSALTAEIGLMKSTEQLASMEMMGVDPIHRIIAPRLWAGLISMPILTILFDATAILGGYLIGVEWLGLDNGMFWNHMQSAVDFRVDILSGIIKSLIFGIMVTWIAVFQGFNCVPTSIGIARATTKTVVYSALVVLGLDLILTAIMIRGW